MVRLLKYLSILALLLPATAFAYNVTSPVTDSFSSFSGWVQYWHPLCGDNAHATSTGYIGSGIVLSNTNPSFCGTTGASTVSSVGDSESSGGFRVWVNKNTSGAPDIIIGVSTSTDAANTDTLPLSFASVPIGWHSIDFIFFDTGTTTQYGAVLDATDSTDFTSRVTWWQTGAPAISYDRVFLRAASGMPDGNYMYFDELTNAFDMASGTTKIISTTPYNNQVLPTTTSMTFGVAGYIAPGDFTSGMSVQATFTNGGFSSTQLVGPIFAEQQQEDNTQTFTWPLANSGVFNFSTTTGMQVIGNYTLASSIHKPYFSFLGFDFFDHVIVASTTFFTISTSTAFGTLRNSVQTDWLVFTGQASSTINTSVCNPLSGNFSVVPCVGLLFIPDKQDMANTMKTVHDNVLQHFPWGYVTRTAVIFAASPTTTLPTISVNIMTSAATSGPDIIPYTLDTNDMFAGGAALLDNTRDPIYGKNLRDVTEPWILLLIGVFILIIIWHDLMAMHHSGGGPRQSNTKT